MNVIVIVADSLRPDYLGCYGNTWVKTPNIDILASKGMLFANAYSEGLPTLPARTSMFTGRFTFPFRGWQRLEPSDVLLSEVLWNQGYSSALITDTYHMQKPSMGFARGFDHVQFIRGQEFDPYVVNKSIEVDRRIESIYKGHPRDPGLRQRLEQYFRNISLWDWENEENHFVAQVVNAAVNWLESRKQMDKLFLWLDCFDPHEPWDPPLPYRRMYDPTYNGKEIIYPVYGEVEGYLTPEELRHVQALYAGEVTMVDKSIGAFLYKLKELGLYENSLLFFTSDHGEPLGDHGIIMKAKPWPYEEIARIPLVIRHPEGYGRGKKCNAFVQTCDLMPTILDYLEVAGPEDVHGRSMIPLIEDAEDIIRDTCYSGFYGRSWSIRYENWKYILWLPQEEARFIACDISVPERTRLAIRKPELYNLKDDPNEMVNLVDTNPQLAEKLELQLRRFVQSVSMPLAPTVQVTDPFFNPHSALTVPP